MSLRVTIQRATPNSVLRKYFVEVEGQQLPDPVVLQIARSFILAAGYKRVTVDSILADVDTGSTVEFVIPTVTGSLS